MKHFLLALFLLSFVGCSKDTDLDEAPVFGNRTYYSPYDSTLIVNLEEDINGAYICLIKDEKRSKKTYIPKHKKEVDKGSGEIVDYESIPEKIVFLKNRIIVDQYYEQGDSRDFDFFTNDIQYIKSVNFESTGLINWDGNVLLVGSDDGNTLKVMNDQGVIVDELNESPDFKWPDIENDNIFFDNYEYIAIRNNEIKRYNLESGRIWRVIYSHYVKNKPETETNSPKIQYMGYSIKENIVSINLDVTYYSGEKESVTLKIDSNNGQVV